ncbi:MAG: sulfatase [Planctomycetota bacterium]|nr:sulfatase [Planctomycetota bacterium]
MTAGKKKRGWRLGVVFFSCLLGCGGNDVTGEGTGPLRGPETHARHVVVYVIDTLRADRLGLYGNDRQLTPAMDELGRTGATFEMAYSSAPWTLPSSVSLFTSTFPTSHGVLSGLETLGDQAQTMVEWFGDLGYYTAGFAYNTLGGRGAGLDQGYDKYFEKPPNDEMTEEQREQGLHTIRPVLRFIRDYEGEAPLFLYVHTVEPHWPFDGSPMNLTPLEGEVTGALKEQANALCPKHRGMLGNRQSGEMTAQDLAELEEMERTADRLQETVEALYDGDVRRADLNLSRVVTALTEKGLWDDTIFVLLADHGEELRERGNWLHGQSVFNELVRVPMVMRIPGVTGTNSRVSQPTQTLDLLPTLADALGAPKAESWQGRSRYQWISEPGLPVDAALPIFSVRREVDRPGRFVFGDSETTVVRGAWKLIVHHDLRVAALYNLDDDPAERKDVAADYPAITASLQEEVETFLRDQSALNLSLSQSGPMEEDKRAHLAELGYLGGGDG